MPDDDFLPRLLDRRYQLDATIGHGGMGVVYRGIDLLMKRPIAVKLVRAVDGVDVDDEVAGRFLREAKNTARIQHEHIVEVFDLGRTEEGSLYFVMELLHGESLSARLRREGKLTPETAVHIVRQVCEALAVAHDAGIIHRDLKPANIMLVNRAGDADFVKVLDFGVAKSYSPDQQTQLTRTGMLVGTLDYMAPEQILGKTVDGRTDMYALGVVLYRMLSGKPPFRDSGVPALIHAHLNTMPKPLIEIGSDIPNALDRVVLRCLAKNADRRYESMTELARALGAALQPDSMRLQSLEYAPDDDDIRTELVRENDDDATLHTGPPSDDATIRFERAGERASGRAGEHPHEDPRERSGDRADERAKPSDDTATLPRADVVRFPRSSVGARAMRVCEMCQTSNPMHVRHCTACGVSLSNTEQNALRERHRSSVAPAIPFTPRSTSSSPAARAAAAPRPLKSSLPPPPRPPPPPAASGEVPVLPWESPAKPPPSMWQRFLSWTGIRNR